MNRSRRQIFDGTDEAGQQTETALTHDAEKFRSLFASNIVGITVTDIKGNIIEANDFFLNMLGYSRDDLPLRWDILTPLEWRDLDQAKVTEVVTTGVDVPWEKEYLAKDGRRVPILVGTTRLAGTDDEYVGIVLDLTKGKQAERQLVAHKAQLQALAATLLLVEERERRRIAKGLHDHVGHILVLAKEKLSGWQAGTPTGDIKQSRAEIRALINQAIQATRTLTFELSSPVLYELGLEAALQSLGERVAQQHDLRVHFETDGQPKPLGDDISVVFYHVARELLFNIVKHARTGDAWMTLRWGKDHLRLTLEDDGVGFVAAGAGERLDEGGGFGLFSIRQQLDHLGGCLEIETAPGHGTQVIVVVPLA